MTRGTKRRRIGPKMWAAAAIVEANPGCTKLFVAERIAPRGPGGTARPGIQFGYSATGRAIAAGLIRAEKLPSGRYRLTRRRP